MDTEVLNNYFILYTLACSAFITSIILRTFFKYVLLVVVVGIALYVSMFFGAIEIELGEFFENSKIMFSVITKYLLDIFEKAGILLIIPFVIGFFTKVSFR